MKLASIELRYFITVSTLALTVAGGGSAFAAGADSPAAAAVTTDNAVKTDSDNTQVDAIVVTGARGVNRTVESSAAPVDVLSHQALEQANKANLLEDLSTIVPSFNLPNVATPDIGSMVRAGQLRGLDPDQTLILVNGKRRHTTAFLGAGGFSANAPADLSLIPSSAIERIEVLRDGASAIYGSDAIAGVINIITNDSDSGGEVTARSGQFYAGDGLTRVFTGDVGFKLPNDGRLHLSAESDDQALVVRNSPVNPNYLFYFPTINGVQVLPTGNGATNGLPVGAVPSPKEATRNNEAWQNQGSAPFRLESGAYDAVIPLGGGTELYSFGTYSHRTSSAPQNFRTPTRDETIRAFYPDGFAPIEAISEDDYEVTAGVRGERGGWNWDLSTDFGEDDLDVFTRNSENPTYGLQSQRNFYDGNLTSTAWTTNLDTHKAIDVLPVKTELSLGAEYRREEYIRTAGDLQSYSYGGQPILDGPNAGKPYSLGTGGAQGLPGFRPSDAVDSKRDSEALYSGLSFDLTSKWIVDLAGRYENYSDFGDTYTGRLSTRYDVTNWLAVRGTVSNGFHAPALAAEAYKNTANINTYTVHTLEVDSPEAIALGAKPLKPETSINYTAGLVLKPADGWTVAVDAYQIGVKNRIAQSTQIRDATYPGTGVLVTAAGFSAADGVSYFINAADSRTTGVELTVEKAQRTEHWGTFRYSLSYDYTDTTVTHIAPTPSVLAAFNVPVFSLGAQRNLEFLSPRDKAVLGIDWSVAGWDVNARESYYGELQRYGTPTVRATTGPYAGLAEIPYNIGGLFITDLSITKKLTDNVNVTVSGNNIFSVKPSKLPTPLLGAYQEYSYTNNGPIGPQGGFYSATLRYRW
jgi:iron complex outermembrane receptor protein